METAQVSNTEAVVVPVRQRLPDTRPAITHKATVGGQEFYINVGLSPKDNMPAEIFITLSGNGSTSAGALNGFAIQTSLLWQYGIPLDVVVGKMIGQRFAPMGPTSNPKIPEALSIIDYIGNWLGLQFIPGFTGHHPELKLQ